MKIAISGLGKMGMQIARKLAEDGHDVIGHDPNTEAVQTAETYGVSPAYSKETLLESFENEQVIIWLMIPAEIVGKELALWAEVLPTGSILIDGGNTDFRKTRQHFEITKTRDISLLDIGTSGGVWGYQNGFSMMVGGEKDSYTTLTPVLDTLAAPGGAHQYFGPTGSGHYVKMVHNAIEYGMMESLAEGYRMLKEGPYDAIDLAAAGDVWQHHSVVTSWLNELTRDALQENPDLTGIEGFVHESGEARWALEAARDANIAMPAIQASFDVRLASQQGEVNFATKLLSAMRNKFGGHTLNK